MKRFFTVSVFLISTLVLSVQASAKHPYNYTINVQVNGIPIILELIQIHLYILKMLQIQLLFLFASFLKI